MRRRTADGIDVCLWDDGALTGSLGYRLRGVPMRRPRAPDAIATARRAGALLLGEVCLWESSELAVLFAACERAARLDGLPGTARRLVRERREREARPRLSWTTLQTDRDGVTTLRFAALPRLFWPGLGVWDTCGKAGSAGGRYELVSRLPQSRDTYVATGFRFATLVDLWTHLRGSR